MKNRQLREPPLIELRSEAGSECCARLAMWRQIVEVLSEMRLKP